MIEIPVETSSFNKSDAPSWVRPIENESIFEAYLNEQSDTHQIFNIREVLIEPDNRETYIHYGRNLADIQDVEYYSSLTITYNPAYENVVIHSISVYRDGHWIDKLHDAKISILQREEELDRLVYDGRKTLMLMLIDIRVDDLLSVAYTIKGANPVFGKWVSEYAYVDSRYDVYDFSVRYLFDDAVHADMEVRYLSGMQPLHRTREGRYTVYTFQEKEIKGITIENDAPESFNPYRRVVFSNAKSWRDVARWAMTLYPDDLYHADAPLLQIVQACKKQSRNTKEQVAYALFYVQEHIRYFADASGLGGYLPLDPNESCRLRFADCKNKVVILKTILNYLGVESYPALVHASAGASLKEEGPSVSAFDHMIIAVDIDGQRYWFDATFTGQAGHLDAIYQPGYHSALVLKEGVDDLVDMPDPKRSSRVEVLQHFDLTRPEASIEIRTTYSGSDADRMRRRSKGRNRKHLLEDYVRYYQKRYPTLKAKRPLVVEDDTHENVLAVTEYYTVDTFWEYKDAEEEYEAYFVQDEINQALVVPEKGERRSPFGMHYPAKVTEKRTIVLPYDWTGETTPHQEKNAYFSFSKEETYHQETRTMEQTYFFEVNTPVVPPEKVAEYIEKAQEVYVTYRLWHRDPYDLSRRRQLQQKRYDEQEVSVHVKETFYVEDYDNLRFEIETTYSLYEAFRMRRKTSTEKKIDRLKKSYLDYYSRRYEDVEPDHFEIRDSTDSFVIVERYRVGNFFLLNEETNRSTLDFSQTEIEEAHTALDVSRESNRLKYPAYVKIDRDIFLSLDLASHEDKSIVDNDFFSFAFYETYDSDAHKLSQHYTYQVKQNTIEKAHYAAYRQDEREIYFSSYIYSHDSEKEAIVFRRNDFDTLVHNVQTCNRQCSNVWTYYLKTFGFHDTLADTVNEGIQHLNRFVRKKGDVDVNKHDISRLRSELESFYRKHFTVSFFDLFVYVLIVVLSSARLFVIIFFASAVVKSMMIASDIYQFISIRKWLNRQRHTPD